MRLMGTLRNFANEYRDISEHARTGRKPARAAKPKPEWS